MKFWKLAAVAGYVAGIAVALKYANKTPAQIESDVKSGKDRLAVLWENLVTIHRSLFSDAKVAAWNPTTQSYVEQAKIKLESLAEDFRRETIAKLEELKAQGHGWAGKAQEEVQRLYDRRLEYLAQAKDLSLDAVAKLRAELAEAYEWAKAQVAAK